jgi:ribosomal protein S18 acetylase RimI-like enzyme
MFEAFQIRRADWQDAPEIARIHVVATRNAYRGIYTDEYLQGLSVERFAQMWTTQGRGHLVTEDPSFAVFVAFDGATMIGFADVGAAGPPEFSGDAQLYAIYLDPAFIGKGAGKALFAACVRHARARRFAAMITEVLSRNALARAFYERMDGEPLPSTEEVIETGGTKEKVIFYRWRL